MMNIDKRTGKIIIRPISTVRPSTATSSNTGTTVTASNTVPIHISPNFGYTRPTPPPQQAGSTLTTGPTIQLTCNLPRATVLPIRLPTNTILNVTMAGQGLAHRQGQGLGHVHMQAPRTRASRPNYIFRQAASTSTSSIRHLSDHADYDYVDPLDSFSAMDHCFSALDVTPSEEQTSTDEISSIYNRQISEQFVREIPIFPSEDMDVKLDYSLTSNVQDNDDSNSSFNIIPLNNMQIPMSSASDVDELNLPSINSDNLDFSIDQQHNLAENNEIAHFGDENPLEKLAEGQNLGENQNLNMSNIDQNDHSRYTNKVIKEELEDYVDQLETTDENDHVSYANQLVVKTEDEELGDEGAFDEQQPTPTDPDHEYQGLTDLSPNIDDVTGGTMTQIIPLIPSDNSAKQQMNKKRASGLELKDSDDPKSLKKKQKILQKVIRKRLDENDCDFEYRKDVEKDMFNLSNDEFYSHVVKGGQFLKDWSDIHILHSLPAQDLDSALYPPDLPENYLRHFHRLPLQMTTTPFSYIKYHADKYSAIKSLNEHVRKISQRRDAQKMATGGGAMFFMRNIDDLSGKDGDLVLCEYSEEHPPLIMQPGMATTIKYLIEKSTNHGGDGCVKSKYGETVYVSNKDRLFYLLGQLEPCQNLHILENTLFRAPIYEHQVPETDFLIMHDNKGIFIRPIAGIFCVGQECPIYEVPAPNSYKTAIFLRDFLLFYIYRLFWMSKENPRRLKSEVLRQLFPSYAESTIRKRLKSCSLFSRLGSGVENNYWLLNNDFNLPSLERIRQLITPEMYCAHFSMLAGSQRLKDAGYGDESSLVNLIDDDDDNSEQPKIDDEIKCAPWHTTRAFLLAAKGKSMLDLVGVADPTGRGEGYSYVKITNKASANALLSTSFYEDKFSSWDVVAAKVKRSINGTDADLRKLSLNQARQMLRDLGVMENEIRMLKRWEIIDIIRTFSTRQARDHRVFSEKMGLTKFARGCLKYSPAEVQDRFRKECQRIFELQNRVLSNVECMSTDDEEDDDSDVECVAEVKDIPLCNSEVARTTAKKSEIVVKKEICSDDESSYNEKIIGQKTINNKFKSENLGQIGSNIDSSVNKSSHNKCRKLKIYRTYFLTDGRQYVNCEIVTDSQLIEAYLKLRTSKDEEFITKFAQQDKDYKIEKRKEKRRLQDKLRRIKRNELKAQLGITPKPRKPLKPPKPKSESLLKMRCSACGGTGHMKTNKFCPMFQQRLAEKQAKRAKNRSSSAGGATSAADRSASAMSRSTEGGFSDMDEDEDEQISSEDEGQAEFTSIQTPPASQGAPQSRQTTPKVPSFVRVEGTKVNINKRLLNKNQPTQAAVDSDEDYVEKPSRKRKKVANTQTQDQNLSNASSEPAIDPLTDHDFLPKNPPILSKEQPNQPSEPAPTAQNRPLQQTRRCRSDPKVQLCSIFERIVDDLRDMPESKYFLQPLSKKSYPNYYEIIEKPMHLSIMKVNVSKNFSYTNRREFFKDLNLLLANSQKFNGKTSTITKCAEVLIEYAKNRIKNDEKLIKDLELRINPSSSFQLDDQDDESRDKQGSRDLQDDLSTFNHRLFEMVSKLKSSIPRYFVTNVDQRRCVHRKSKSRDHYIDVQSIETSCVNRRYTTISQFLTDFEKMAEENDVVKARATMKAKEILAFIKTLIQQNFESLNDLQQKLANNPAIKQEFSNDNMQISSQKKVAPYLNTELSEIDKRSGNFFNDASRIKIEIVDLEDTKPKIDNLK